MNDLQHCSRRWISLLLILSAGSAGCSRTVTGGFVDSPSNIYRLYCRCLGPSSPVNLDGSAKTIQIQIVTNDANERVLFKSLYRVHGSNVTTDATWNQDQTVTVMVFDYGDNVAFHGEKKDEPPRRVLRTIACHLNAKTGKFEEERLATPAGPSPTLTSSNSPKREKGQTSSSIIFSDELHEERKR